MSSSVNLNNADMTPEVQLEHINNEALWTENNMNNRNNTENNSNDSCNNSEHNQVLPIEDRFSFTQFQEKLNEIYEAGLRVIRVGDAESLSKLDEINNDIDEMSRTWENLTLSPSSSQPISDNVNDNDNNNNKKQTRKKRNRRNKNNKGDDRVIQNSINTLIEDTVNTSNPETTTGLSSPVLNEGKGDTLDMKPEDHLRFLFQNAHSFRPPIMDKWKAIISKILELKCDVVGFCETEINWRLKKVQKKYKSALFSKSHTFGKLVNPHMTVSPISLPFESERLPGGTAMITSGRWTTQIHSQVTDFFKMGRWSGNCYRLSGSKKLYIISAYRPCPLVIGPTNSMSTAHQQAVMLAARNIHDSNPRRQFILDFINQFGSICNNDDNYVLLALDANSVLEEDTNGMGKLLRDCGMIDLYTTITHDNSQFPTHTRGSKKIDYLLGTHNIIPFITRIGYVKFHEAFDSDHRAVFADISNTILEDPIKPDTKRIRLVGSNSTNEESERYIRHLYNFLQKKDIFNRVADLYKAACDNTMSKSTIMQELNICDDIITTAMLKYEKSTCSMKDRAYWSPELEQSNLLIQFWNILHKSIQQQVDASKRLHSICQYLDTATKLLICHWQCPVKTALRQALNSHKLLLKNHFQLREHHLQKKVDDENERIGSSEVLTITKLIRRERKRQDHSYIRRLIKNQHSKGLTVLEIPTSNNPEDWEEITDPVEIETNLIHKSIDHFSQANNTPFCQPPLKEVFGYEGTTADMINMIKQQMIPLSIQRQPMYVNLILERLATSGKNLPEIDSDITFEEMVSGYVKWNERTTTSPSGRHLGHYKILTRLQVIDETDNNIYLNQELLKLYYMVTMTAVKVGGSLTRWKTISTCMIQKIPGVNRINKLRVIHLYEADYNLLLKLMWARKGVWHLCDHDAIHDGQAGSRPGKRAIDVILQKEMKYLYAALTRTPLGTIDNDATSCYDRIVCSLAIGICIFYGIPINYCRSLAETLKESVFRVRTALGDSKATYQHSDSTPIHGSGQGSCVSPALWLMQSSFIMEVMEEIAHGMKIVSVDGSEAPLVQMQEGFVDDISNYANNDFKDTCIHNLHSTLQEDGRKWVGMLEGTGGKLELTKCFDYLLSWGWDSNGSPYPIPMNQQPIELSTINIRQENKPPEYIKQRDVSESHKTLGAFKTICGKEADHLKYLHEKSNNIIARLRSGQLNRRQAKMAYNVNYIPAILYSLSAMCLTEAQLSKIQQSSLGKFLQIMGFEEKFPRTAVFAPFIYGGLGLRQIFSESMCQKMECLICHVNYLSSLGKSMRTNITWIHILLGVGTPLLESQQFIKYLHHNWFLNIRDFLIQIESKVKIRDLWQPQLLRYEDFFIMQKLDTIQISKRECIVVNNWRIYLQVLTLSNIANAAGDKIRPEFFDRNCVGDWEPTSKLQWPNQDRPPINTFCIWKRFLKKMTGCDNLGYLSNSKLGAWKPGYDTTIQVRAVIHTNHRSMATFCDVTKTWTKYNFTSRRYSYFFFDKATSEEMADFDLTSYFPVDYTENNLELRVCIRNLSRMLITSNSEQRVCVDSFQSYVRTTRDWKSPLLHSMQLYNQLRTGILSQDEIVICSDGGVRRSCAGFGVVMSNNNSIVASTNMLISPGHNAFTSYRSEAMGVLGAMVLYDRLQEFTLQRCGNRATVQVRFLCDNEALVKTLNKLRRRPITPKFYYLPDVDIIKEILVLIRAINRNGQVVEFKHVKGHQDRNPGPLSFDASLNVQADQLATASLQLPQHHKLDMPNTKATLLIQDKVVTSHHSQQIREAYHLIALKKHYKNLNSWDEGVFDTVWWEAHGMALSTLRPGELTTIQKLLQHRLPCNRRENMYYGYIGAECRTCGELEHQNHY
jgi:hypothetical protein